MRACGGTLFFVCLEMNFQKIYVFVTSGKRAWFLARAVVYYMCKKDKEVDQKRIICQKLIKSWQKRLTDESKFDILIIVKKGR